MKKWYCIPHKNEVGSYEVSETMPDFLRGIILAYGHCCLIKDINSKEEAIKLMAKYPCKKVAQRGGKIC